MQVSTIGPYRIIRKLSAGGMGTVYEAIHEAIERRVAIKILHPQLAASADTVRRFFNEAKAANRIDHPAIVQVQDCGQLPDGTSFIVMEFLRGETLGRRLRRPSTRRLLAHNLRLMAQVAEALAAAHAAGIIHRDMKPDNVMVVGEPSSSSGERVKILDFGIAKLRDAGANGQTQTRDGLLGTPTYMSPEQCNGASTIDSKTDVYSVGIMLYRIVAKRPPFMAEGTGAVIAMHLMQEPPPLKDLAPWVQPELAAFIHSLLVKNRELRPTMPQVATTLASLAKSLEGFVIPSTEEDDKESEELIVNAAGADADSSAIAATVSSVPGGTPPSWQQPRPAGSVAAGTAASAASAQSAPSGHSFPSVTLTSRSGLSLEPPRPSLTTLGNSSGQQAAPAVRRGLPRVIAMGGAAGVGAVLAIAWVARTATHPVEQTGTVGAAASPKTAPVQKVPVEAAVVRWNITTIPAGAQLLRKQDGAVMGKTPWRQEQAAAVGSEQVRVVAEGFQEQTLTLNLAESSERTLSLLPVQVVSAGAVELKEPSERTRKGKNKATSVHKPTVPGGEKPRITDSTPKVKHSDVLED
jgi:serine/threonine protein kinase